MGDRRRTAATPDRRNQQLRLRAGGLPFEQINNSTGAVLYLHHDQQGSTRLLTGSTGKTEATFTYDAYGNTTGTTGTAKTPLGYDAQYTSSDTGLIYVRARVYDPKTAQFLSVDPLDELTWAPYNYGNDNPANYTDVDGLAGEPTNEGYSCPSPLCFPLPSHSSVQHATEALEQVGGDIGHGVKTVWSAIFGEESQSASTTQPAEPGTECEPAPRSLPYTGEPNSTGVLDRRNGSGQIRDYGPDGLPLKDYDFGHDHGFGDPHAHDWVDGVREPGRPIEPNE